MVITIFQELVLQVIEDNCKYWEVLSSTLAVGWLDISVSSFVALLVLIIQWFSMFYSDEQHDKKIFSIFNYRLRCCVCMDLINWISLELVRLLRDL